MVAISGVPAQSGPVEKLREFRRDMSATQWLQTKLMFASILLLHVIGFGVFFVFVVPAHYKGLGIGVAVLAYTLGLRHAFDADHISAIDNTTRKLMNEGKKPLSVGYFFSLGHSTIVIAIGAGIVIAEKAVYGAVVEQRLGARAVWRDLRHHRFGRIPLPHRLPQHRDPGRHHSPCSARCATATMTRRNSRSSWRTGASCIGCSAHG